MQALFKNWFTWMDDARQTLFRDTALLLLRLTFGLTMLTGHGWKKMMNFGKLSQKFPDPIGLGSSISLTLAVSAEVFCSVLLIIGLATRLSAIPLITTMLVAIFVIHGADPFQKKEMAVLYLTTYTTLLLAGPGRFSIDALLRKKVMS